MANRLNDRGLRFAARFCTGVSGLAIAFGLFVLSGWAFHIQRFKTIIPGQVTVMANTAVCFISLGLALWLVRKENQHSAIASAISRYLGLGTSLIGLLSFLEFWKGRNLIDELLFRPGLEDLPGSVRPGLMSPLAALNFFLFGIVLTSFDLKARWVRWVQSLFISAAATAAIFGILDFIFDPHKTHTHISPATAALLLLMSFALVCSRTTWGLGALLVSESPGGEISRRLLPAAIVVPLTISWLRWKAQEAGWFTDWSGLGIMTVSAGALLVGLIVWTALVIDKTDGERRKAAESSQNLAAIVNSSNDGIIGKTLDGIVTSWNPRAEAMYGYSAEEMVRSSATVLIPPERVDEFKDIMRRVGQGESVHSFETTRIRKDGNHICVSLSVAPIRDTSGKVIGASTITRDVTEQKVAEQKLNRVNQTLQALSACTDSMMRARDESGLLQQVCDALVRVGGYRMAWIGYAEHDANKTVRPVAHSGTEDGYLLKANITWADEERGRGPTGAAVRTGKTIVARDFATDPRLTPWREEAARRGYRCSIVLPLRDEKAILGAINIYSGEVDAFDTREEHLLEQLGSNLSYAIMTLRAHAQRAGTEQKLRESSQALQLERQRFRDVLDKLPSYVVLLTPDYHVALDNAVFRERFGESKGRPCYEFLFHRDLPCENCETYNVLKTGTPHRWKWTGPDGRHYDIFDFPFPDADGSPLILEMGMDVTEREQAEEEIRKLNRDLEKRVQQRTAQLQESEQGVRRKLDSILLPEGDLGNLQLADILDIPAIQSLLDDFYQVIPVTTGVVDLQGRVLAVPAWQKICAQFHRAHPGTCKNCVESDVQLSAGVPPGEFRIYKCKNNMLDAATPIMIGDRHMGNLYLGQFLFADEPIDQEVFRTQARQYGFDEAEYLAALDSVPRLSRDTVNACIGFLAKLSKVISQLSYSGIKLARSSTQISRANADLAASNKELEAFTYSVSHDLRAPLRHISGFSKILSEEFSDSLPPDAQHHVQRIQEGTRRMGQLVDDLLNLGRVGRKELSLQVAGIRSIVDEVLNGLRTEIGDRKVEWRIGDLPFVECDTSLLHQVFQNLLSNALKFTRPRAQAVIEIGQEQRGGASVIYVRDNGVGFSMKYADKLFGVFQRLHRSEDFEGTGVGLATVQRIIQKHGGRIWAEAELDKGAVFYFTLGAAEAGQDALTTASAAANT